MLTAVKEEAPRRGLPGAKPVFAEVVAREGGLIMVGHKTFAGLETHFASICHQKARLRKKYLAMDRTLDARAWHEFKAMGEKLGELLTVAETVGRQAEAHLAQIERCGPSPLCYRYPAADPTVAQCRVAALARMAQGRRPRRRRSCKRQRDPRSQS